MFDSYSIYICMTVPCIGMLVQIMDVLDRVYSCCSCVKGSRMHTLVIYRAARHVTRIHFSSWFTYICSHLYEYVQLSSIKHTRVVLSVVPSLCRWPYHWSSFTYVERWQHQDWVTSDFCIISTNIVISRLANYDFKTVDGVNLRGKVRRVHRTIQTLGNVFHWMIQSRFA